jgi:pimeloyl-ACP methyl ester carboxylesterase
MSTAVTLPYGYFLHSIRERDLACRLQGDPHGKLVIAMHGFCMNATMFSQFGEANKDDFATVAFDFPGHGFSPSWEDADYRVQSGINLLHDGLMDAACENTITSEPYTLLGHSIGALWAIKYAAAFPAQTRSVILLSIAYRSPYKLQFHHESVEDALARSVRPAFVSSNAEPRRSTPLKVPLEGSVANFHYFDGMPEREIIRYGFRGTHQDTAEAILRANWQDDIRPDLQKISEYKIPVLFIYGTNDVMVAEEDVVKAADMVENSRRCRIEGGTHNHPVRFPKTFIDTVREHREYLHL